VSAQPSIAKSPQLTASRIASSARICPPSGDRIEQKRARESYGEMSQCAGSASTKLELVFPGPATILKPDIQKAADNEIVIDLASPFEVTWQPTDGFVAVALRQVSPSTTAPENALAIDCWFPAADGHGTLPLEGLAGFEPGPNAPESWIGITHQDRFKGELGDGLLSVEALNGPSRRVTLQ